jgi:hypothetical protein
MTQSRSTVSTVMERRCGVIRKSNVPDAGGIAAISRWLSDSDTTGMRPQKLASRRDASKRSKLPTTHTAQAGIPLGCIVFWISLRRCRYAQPPANRSHASGMTQSRGAGSTVGIRWQGDVRHFGVDLALGRTGRALLTRANWDAHAINSLTTPELSPWRSTSRPEPRSRVSHALQSGVSLETTRW